MKIPDKIKICGSMFDSKYSDSILSHSNALGTSHIQYGDVSVSKNKLITKEFKEVAYLHEIFHNINFILELFEEETEEKLIIRLSNCIHMIFSDNTLCFTHNFEIPHEIKIGGIIYSIELVQNLYKSPVKKIMSINHVYSDIKLDYGESVSRETTENAFLIAIMFATNHQFHIFNEENVIELDAFTNMFYQILKDNKELCFCES